MLNQRVWEVLGAVPVIELDIDTACGTLHPIFPKCPHVGVIPEKVYSLLDGPVGAPGWSNTRFRLAIAMLVLCEDLPRADTLSHAERVMDGSTTLAGGIDTEFSGRVAIGIQAMRMRFMNVRHVRADASATLQIDYCVIITSILEHI